MPFVGYNACMLAFCKSNPVLLVAALAAVVSAFFVTPDAAYLGYFDWHTLLCLWAMLAVLCAFRSIGVFALIARRFVQRFKTVRSVVLVLVMVTFVGSAFLTNDMALLTFLPLTSVLLSSCGQERYIPFTFIMQTLAANLGGMILPFGNPQNLYLFSYYQLGLGEFAATLLPAFTVSLVLIVGCCLFVKPVPLSLQVDEAASLPQARFALYLALFAAVILMVFELVPYVVAGFAVLAVLLVAAPQVHRKVDYALLLTFVCFFIFSGNLTRIPAVQEALSTLLGGGAFVVGVVTSQVISNVPSAILLAPFTADWQGLLLGVDIGGLGTPVASLASLITIAELQRCLPAQTGRFLLQFEIYNFAFLAVLVVVTLVLAGV